MRNEDFLSYKVSVLSRILDRGVDKKLVSGLNLPLTSLRILGHLHAHGEGRVLAIARSMHLLGSQVSQSMMAVSYTHLLRTFRSAVVRLGIRTALGPSGSTVALRAG